LARIKKWLFRNIFKNLDTHRALARCLRLPKTPPKKTIAPKEVLRHHCFLRRGEKGGQFCPFPYFMSCYCIFK
jgi:hypothetical protein